MPFFRAQDPEKIRLAFQGYCRGALRGFFEGSTERSVCVDKSRGWLPYYDWLCDIQPQPKILVCVRDLRAILSSMEKRWRKHPHLQRPDEDSTGLKMSTVQSRVAHWLNSVPVGNAITTLMGAVEAGHHRSVHIVRFEDLTTKPEQTLQRIYAYLEEVPFAHNFENVVQTTLEDDSQYGIYGDHRIRQKVAPVASDYHETLGKELSNIIKADNASFYATFYPEK